MTEYYIPATSSVTEFTEKKSRFIGHVMPVNNEEDARAFIEKMKKQYHDARHNCWCYCLHDGDIVRYSDDGEPQGTAGQPMLEVMQHMNITNACCVVTRYFGGVLLGTGGLCRAYTKSAQDAIEAAGKMVVRLWELFEIDCPYNLYQKITYEIEKQGGVVGKPEYGESIIIRPLLPEGCSVDFCDAIINGSGGTVKPHFVNVEERAVLL